MDRGTKHKKCKDLVVALKRYRFKVDDYNVLCQAPSLA
jgi:hypothetical protein